MNIVIGIDPDIKGGIAICDPYGTIELFDMPVKISSFGCRIKQKPHLIVDCEVLCDLLQEKVFEIWSNSKGALYNNPTLVQIEKVHSIRGQGIVSAFTFGRTVGMIVGVVSTLYGEPREIMPQTWKREFGLLGSPKDASRLLAIERFPELEPDLRKKKDIGKADALWIALAT